MDALFTDHTADLEAMLVSGGWGVEVISPSGGVSCQLPSLEGDERVYHTQEGGLLCGGGWFSHTVTTCLRLAGPGWETSHQLQTQRFYHASCQLEPGVLLLGGGGGHGHTTELVRAEGGTELMFTLKYNTM